MAVAGEAPHRSGIAIVVTRLRCVAEGSAVPRRPSRTRTPMARPFSILFELRYPTRWYTKLAMAILALAFFAVLATSAIAGFLVYRIIKPQRTSSEINLQSFPGRPDAVEFSVPGRGPREGYFFQDYGARRRSFCAMATNRAAENC